MALIDSLNSTTLGLNGETPPNREGASADTSKVHVDGGTQTADHSALDLDGAAPAKYTDNPPT
jgi:hypothetical protein